MAAKSSQDVRDYLSTLPPLKEGDTADEDTDFGYEGEEPMTLPDRPRDEEGRFVTKPVQDIEEQEDLLSVKLGGDDEPAEEETEEEDEKPVTPNDETPADETASEEPAAEESAPEQSTDELWADLRSRLEGLPEADQARILLSLGYIDEATAQQYLPTEPAQEPVAETAPDAEEDLYEPVGPIEQKLHPVLNDLVAMPQRIQAQEQNFATLTQELNSVLVAQRDALDAAVIQNAAQERYLQHIAELNQWESPKIDVKAAVDALRKGQSLEAVLDEQMKATFEKNKARAEQARKARPDTLREGANGHLQMDKKDSMADIVMKMRGVKVG